MKELEEMRNKYIHLNLLNTMKYDVLGSVCVLYFWLHLFFVFLCFMCKSAYLVCIVLSVFLQTVICLFYKMSSLSRVAYIVINIVINIEISHHKVAAKHSRTSCFAPNRQSVLLFRGR